MRFPTIFIALLALSGAAQAGERATVNRRTGLFETPLSDLRKAAEHGDRAELARLMARLGPARVAKALQDPDRRIVQAALDGVPLMTSGVLLLDSVLPLLASADASIRGGAVRAAAALVAANDAARLAEWEIAEETAKAACQALVTVAVNETEALPTRVLALQGFSDAPALCATTRLPASLLGSPEPEIRRAAVLGMPAASMPIGTLLAATQDRDSSVAAAAGARLCERRAKSSPAPASLSLGKLALADGTLPEDVVAMLPCLIGSKDPADQKALDDLQSTGPAAVREAIRAQRRVGTSP